MPPHVIGSLVESVGDKYVHTRGTTVSVWFLQWTKSSSGRELLQVNEIVGNVNSIQHNQNQNMHYILQCITVKGTCIV